MPDGTQCFATGDDHGQIHIYDAKRLMALVRPDDPLQAKAILESGGKSLKAITPAFTEPARLTTLALHSDWVSSLAYEESLRGLVSASLDTTIRISTFDWPPPPPRDSQENVANACGPGQQQRKIPRDATSTRAVLRCHSKGVTSVVTMQAALALALALALPLARTRTRTLALPLALALPLPHSHPTPIPNPNPRPQPPS